MSRRPAYVRFSVITRDLTFSVMMVMRFGVQPAAFAAFHDDAVCVLVGDVDEQLRLAGAAAIGFITASFAKGRARLVIVDVDAFGVFRVDEDHVELGH